LIIIKNHRLNIFSRLIVYYEVPQGKGEEVKQRLKNLLLTTSL
jgi:hypothetical protein